MTNPAQTDQHTSQTDPSQTDQHTSQTDTSQTDPSQTDPSQSERSQTAAELGLRDVTGTHDSAGGCACGHEDEHLPELDARAIPHAIRHGAIFGSIGQLRPGASLVLIAPHDPLPLLAQLQDREGDAVAVEYVQRGPQDWKLKMTRAL